MGAAKGSEHIYQAHIIASPGLPPISEGALVVQGERIIAIGTASQLLKEYPIAEITDFGDAILFPPLVNAHTHLELTLFPEWARLFNENVAPSNFIDWMLRMIRVKRQIAREAFAPSLTAGLRSSLQSGVGAVGDILSSHWARAAYHDSPMLGQLFYEVLGRDSERNHQLLATVKTFLDDKTGMMQSAVSPHAPYTITPEFLSDVMSLATERDVPLSIHLGESREEVEFLAEATGPLIDKLYPFVGWQNEKPAPSGKSPLTWLASCGQLSPRTLLVHTVQVDDVDIAAIAAADATVVLCPRSNEKLGVGKAPAGAMQCAGIRLTLGTDSLASNDSLSIWDEVAFARNWFAGELDPATLLKMATINGAQALGLDGELGRLETGWGAHFQLLRPRTLPAIAELDDFLTSPGRTDEVEALYLRGRNIFTNQMS